MSKVAEIRNPESYVEATHDGNWQTTMEGEIRALIVNETWDLVDPPRHCKPIG